MLHPEITFFAKTNFRGREVPFGIKTDDRRRHMYVIGKTGMGKTTMMENMVIQDILNGHGVCFMDPHGDSVAKILDFIPSSRINDVVYFNPADIEHPIAFNILESVDTKYKHLVASGLMGVFTKIWANMWSARMEYILNNTILALLDSPGNTMLGITRMYIDKKYRKKIVDNIKDPMVKSFWMDEFANYNEKFRSEAVAPIQNKVGQFLSSAIIRNIVGQPKSTIDLRDIMDNKKILLMDLSKGKVGEDNSALLGAMVVTKLQLAALSRVDIPEADRKDFYLYVDEFQNFVNESFATILSEARKYRLNLTIGHQYIGQLSTDRSTVVRDAVFGNVGTMVVFRVGAADAEFLETEFEPIFTPPDIVNLPKYHVLMKLMINGVSSDPFSATTMPPDESMRSGNAEKVIKVSRERYANSREEVEDKIGRWMGAEFHEEAAKIANVTATDVTAISTVAEPVVVPVAAESSREEVNESIEESTPMADLAESEEPVPTETVPTVPQRMPQLVLSNQAREEVVAKPPIGASNNSRPFTRPSAAPDRGPKFSHRSQRTDTSRSPHHPPRRSNRPQDGRRHQPKRDNPIWQTAGQISRKKDEDLAKSIASAMESAFTHEKTPQPPAPAQPQAEQDTKVIQPGEVHKF
jgi:hypothetical protein